MLSFAKRVVRRLRERGWIPKALLRPFYFVDFIYPARVARTNRSIRNFQLLIPAQRVVMSSPERDPFVRIAKCYRDGTFDRGDIFVCEVPNAFLNVDSGITCTADGEVLVDLEARETVYRKIAQRKPNVMRQGKVRRLAGLYSTINYFAASNYYQWMVDCLPKLYSLAQASPTEPVTLLMPESLGKVHRESLDCILPPHFRVEFFPADTWVQTERFLWPSLISSSYNGFLPTDYYESIRQPVFQRYGLTDAPAQKDRIYISRRNARCRRVLNEDAVMELLRPHGFRLVELEGTTFREQVEIFRRAEIVIGPNGAAFNLIVFCDHANIVVLSPCRVPETYFHTMAMGLGHKYHFTLGNAGQDDNFEADLPQLKRVIEEELRLQPMSA